MESNSGAQSGGSNQGSGGSRGKLVQRLLSASTNLPGFVNDLLTTQAVVVAGTEAAGFIIERKEPAAPAEAGGSEAVAEFSLRPIAHIRPDNATAEVRAQAIQAFQDLIKPCLEQKKDGAIEVGTNDGSGESQFCLITLLRNEGDVVAVSAVVARARNVELAQQRLQSMQLVAGYFDLYNLRRTAEQSRVIAQSHQHVLQLVTAVSTAEGFQNAANNFCNELALRTGAVRVSLGWIKGNNVRVKALSHTENFDKKQELIVFLERAMEESLDQDEMVQFDPQGQSNTQNVTRSSEVLSRAQGGNIVLSLPLRRQSEQVGVVTLEFSPEQRLSTQAASGLAVAVDLLAPQLYDRFQNDRYLVTKAAISTRETYKMAIGPRHWLAKTLIVSGIAAIAFVILYSPMYHVTAPFQFASVEKRSLSAPFDNALIDKVFVKPGGKDSIVKKGQVLLVFNTTELELEKSEAVAQARRMLAEAERSRVDSTKIAEYKIAMAQREEALISVRRADERIAKATIIAPFDGEILKGEWKDKVGSVVKQGDVMFELARGDALKVEMTVAERDVQLLREDGTQRGFLATSSLPTDKYPFIVDSIIKIGVTRGGNNQFRVFGRIDRDSTDWPADADSHTGWLPGMQGEARVEVANRSLAWQWSHRLVEWVRLKLWI